MSSQTYKEFREDRASRELRRREAMYDRLEAAIDNFQWGIGDTVLGEVRLDREANMLRLDVFVWDTDDEQPDEQKGLTVSIEVDPYEAPRNQIRNLIHFHVTHEADEQMAWTEHGPDGFRIERPFYPHNPDGSLRDV